MFTLLGRPMGGAARHSTAAVAGSRRGGGVHATVIVRTLLARALHAKWVTREEGVAVMRWLDRLDTPAVKR